MDLIKLKEQLLEMGNKIGLQVQEESAQSLTLHAELTAKDYFDNSIYLNVTIYNSGTMHMFLTFNEIERTYDNLYLINNFNAEHPWFNAYIANINEKDYLELHYSSLFLKDDLEVINSFGYLLDNLLSENTLSLLKPILNAEN